MPEKQKKPTKTTPRPNQKKEKEETEKNFAQKKSEGDSKNKENLKNKDDSKDEEEMTCYWCGKGTFLPPRCPDKRKNLKNNGLKQNFTQHISLRSK